MLSKLKPHIVYIFENVSEDVIEGLGTVAQLVNCLPSLRKVLGLTLQYHIDWMWGHTPEAQHWGDGSGKATSS